MTDLVTKNGPRSRVINPRAALILGVVVAVAVVGMRRLHDQQFSRTLQFLRDTAFKSVAAKDYRTAQLQLTQYLAMKSNDLEAREQLSLLLTEHIRTPQALEQAFRLNEELLRKGQSDNNLRLRHARVAVQLKRMSDADAHLKLLQNAMPDNAEVWYFSGLTAEATRNFTGAAASYKRSIRCGSKVPEAFAALARLETDETPPEFKADTLLEQMVLQCPTAKAHQIRADYLIAAGRGDDAINDLWLALEETPEDLPLNAKLVRCLQRSVKLTAVSAQQLSSPHSSSASDLVAKAIKHFRMQVEKSPQNANMRVYLAAILWKNGDRSLAISAIEKGILKNPRAFALHQTLIEYLVSTGEAVKARRMLESIPAGALTREVAHYCLGRILMTEERWKEACAEFEESLAFGKKDSGLHSQAQLSLAICRSRSGDASASLESFRAVVSDNPESVSARLGMASAWVRSGQLDLAIAEYRQMQDVPGVPAYLADLLIQKNLQQPSSLRNWTEVDELLREHSPAITDAVQRLLLRADRLFAAGEILSAIRTLENGKSVYPNRREVTSALARLSGEHAAGIRDRLVQLVKDDPANPELHAALIMQSLVQPVSTEVLSKTIEIAKPTALLNREQSLHLAIQTLRHIVEMNRRVNRLESVAGLDEAAIKYATQLASMNPAYERTLIRSLVESDKVDEAIMYLGGTAVRGEPKMRAAAILELARHSGQRNDVFEIAAKDVYSLVTKNPADVSLRLSYADLMILGRQYSIAEQTLEPLQSIANQDGAIDARRAWIRAAEERDLEEALRFATEAVKLNSREPAFREVQARVLLTQKMFGKSLEVLQTIPAESLSLAGQVYRAVALWNLDRTAEAQVVFDQIHAQNDADFLFPADNDLLRTISNRFLQPTTALR